MTEIILPNCDRRRFLKYITSGAAGISGVGSLLEPFISPAYGSDDGDESLVSRALYTAGECFSMLGGRGLSDVDSLDIGYDFSFKRHGPQGGNATIRMKNIGPMNRINDLYLATFDMSIDSYVLLWFLGGFLGIESFRESLKSAQKCIIETFTYDGERFQTDTLLEVDKNSRNPLHEIDDPRIRLRMKFNRDCEKAYLWERENPEESDSLVLGGRNGPIAEYANFMGNDGLLSEKQPTIIKEMVCPLKREDRLGANIDELKPGERVYRIVAQRGKLEYGGSLEKQQNVSSSTDLLTFRDESDEWSRGFKDSIFFLTLMPPVDFVRAQSSNGLYQMPAHASMGGLASEILMRDNAKELREMDNVMKKLMKRYKDADTNILKRDCELMERWNAYREKRNDLILPAKNVKAYLKKAEVDELDWSDKFVERMLGMCYKDGFV